MAGYDWSEGKSNNAVDAEDRGLMTAGDLAKSLGLRKASTIQEFLFPCEWHHSSKFFNEIDYFDPEEVTPDLLAKMKAFEMASLHPTPEILDDCLVEWCEWEGSRRSPRRIDRSAKHVQVTVKGDWANFEINGVHYRKKISGNYFSITGGIPRNPSLFDSDKERSQHDQNF